MARKKDGRYDFMFDDGWPKTTDNNEAARVADSFLDEKPSVDWSGVDLESPGSDAGNWPLR